MSDKHNIISCGICKFQSDGRISLTGIMHKHGFVPGKEIKVYIKEVIK